MKLTSPFHAELHRRVIQELLLRTVFALVVTLTASFAVAQQAGAPATPGAKLSATWVVPELDVRLLRIICDELRGQVKLPSSNNTDYLYRWEITLLMLAGTSPDEPEEVRMEKVKAWMKKYWPLCRCDADTFSILNKPHIMFYAFNLLNEDFITFVITDYEPDLNIISHDQTLLDYVQSEIKRYPPLQDTYERFYRYFRNNGAKHKHEL